MMPNVYTPVHSRRVRNLRFESGRWHISELGLEARCSTCKQFWPADTEFYHAAKSNIDGLASQCKACYAETRRRYEDKKRG